jgi:hypothetical protein
MRRVHLVTSLVTGETSVLSDAPIHDDDAPMTSERARAMMELAIDDCPLCQAERARTGAAPEPILRWTEGDPPLTADPAATWMDAGVDPDRGVNWWHGRRPRKRGRS